MSNAKVIINTQAVSIELEGEDGFVRTYLDKLMPIIERSRIEASSSTNKPKTSQGMIETSPEPGLVEQTAVASASPSPRTRGGKRVAGGSCRDRIKILRGEGFFDAQRGISDVVKALQGKGHAHNTNQVGAALSTMFDRGELHRQSVEGRFKYSWAEAEQPKAA